MKKRKPAASDGMRQDRPAHAGREPRGAGPFAAIDLETVRELARIASEFDLAEVEVEASGRVRVARRIERGPSASPSALPASSVAPSLTIMPAALDKGDEGIAVVASPFVGTFYRSPSPDTPVFVEVGQTVRKGQVVCIVEAMKLMNEIESDYDGKVVEIVAKNAEHVEYGQALFRIEKS